MIVREPRDILVSAYHHFRFRSQKNAGSLSDFIRDERTGVAKIVTAYQRWFANRRLASSFEVTSYEAMHARPADVLRQTLDVIGLPADEALVSEAIDFGRFESMSKFENPDFFKDGSIRRSSADRPAEMRMVRAGKTQSYKHALSAEDMAYIDQVFAEVGGNPFESYCRAA